MTSTDALVEEKAVAGLRRELSLLATAEALRWLRKACTPLAPRTCLEATLPAAGPKSRKVDMRVVAGDLCMYDLMLVEVQQTTA